MIAETKGDVIKRLNERKDNMENRGMRVNMNKAKVIISRERQNVMPKAARGHVVSVVEVLVVIQCNVLVNAIWHNK